MGRTFSITMPSMVGIVGGAPAVEEKVGCFYRQKKCDVLFVTGRLARSAAMPVLFLLSGPKMFFFVPQGRHVVPINVKFGTGE